MKPSVTSLAFQFERDEITSLEYVHGITDVYRSLRKTEDDDFESVAKCIENIMLMYNDNRYVIPTSEWERNMWTPTEDVEEFAVCLEAMVYNFGADPKALFKELNELLTAEINRLL